MIQTLGTQMSSWTSVCCRSNPVGFLLMAELYMYFLSLHFIVVHSISLLYSFSFLNIFPDENLPEAFYVLMDVLLFFPLL